ncbi:MAG: hypothetical protein GC145_17695 [Caulobacter sp.]|nr:hypothetical protein [Caulobacter sp.]
MADGSLNLVLDEWLKDRLKAGAANARLTEPEFVRFVLEQHLYSPDALDREDQRPGETLEAAKEDVQELLVPLEDALSKVRERVRAFRK